MTYLTGQAAGDTVSAITNGCAMPWPCAGGRTCPGSVLGAPEIPPLLADWSKGNNKLHNERQGQSFYKMQTRKSNNITVHIMVAVILNNDSFIGNK